MTIKSLALEVYGGHCGDRRRPWTHNGDNPGPKHGKGYFGGPLFDIFGINR